MSFLIDSPLFYGGGRAYERATRASQQHRSRDTVAGAAFMAIFWRVSRRVWSGRDRCSGRERAGEMP
ncbi:MAG: hypothetical protein ABSG95_01255 [Solirubrobacteraceae bacterium]|jgi:hypothetical protein